MLFGPRTSRQASNTQLNRTHPDHHPDLDTIDRIRAWLYRFETAPTIERAVLRIEPDAPVRLEIVGPSIPCDPLMAITETSAEHRLVGLFATGSDATKCVVSLDPDAVTAADIDAVCADSARS